MLKFGESKHPVFRSTSPLSRGVLKSKGGGNTGVASIPIWKAEGPTGACPTVAPLLVVQKGVDTGTLERVANWSPDVARAAPLIHATRAPTQPTALMQVSTTAVSFNLDWHGEVLEAVVVCRDLARTLVSTPPSACRSAVGLATVCDFSSSSCLPWASPSSLRTSRSHTFAYFWQTSLVFRLSRSSRDTDEHPAFFRYQLPGQDQRVERNVTILDSTPRFCISTRIFAEQQVKTSLLIGVHDTMLTLTRLTIESLTLPFTRPRATDSASSTSASNLWEISMRVP